jgi:hypothetical protein
VAVGGEGDEVGAGCDVVHAVTSSRTIVRNNIFLMVFPYLNK